MNASATEVPAANADSEAVPIERPLGTVNRMRSWHSRLSAIFAVGLMGAIGVGLLVWYYAGLMEKGPGPDPSQSVAAQRKAEGEMVLPPLGPLPAPVKEAHSTGEAAPALEGSVPPASSSGWTGSILGPPPVLPPAASGEGALTSTAGGTPSVPTPLARQLGGAVFASAAANLNYAETSFTAPIPGDSTMTSERSTPATASGRSALQDALNVPATELRVAGLMPPRQWLLPKGAFIDCTLETAIDSSLPGMTTCITAVDTFSADGRLVLIERGTKLIGETRGEVQRGTARVFVAWSEARTPQGVAVPLASPGTDELGRSGLAGEVDRHFWDRFGAAMLISVVEGVIDVAVANAQDGSGNTVIQSPGTMSNVLTEVLKDTVNLAPTLRKAHGEAIQILVARDIDFRGVYALARR